MDIDNDAAPKGELKIKGQAEIEKRKSKWEDEPKDSVRALCYRRHPWLIYCLFVLELAPDDA